MFDVSKIYILYILTLYVCKAHNRISVPIPAHLIADVYLCTQCVRGAIQAVR